ncbi:MAG TPA: FHA domain-containing protein [Thermoanaerobaculia bacterium]|nr:FHA domain-containing protein [Thermoanaerobaculia bacterium]
MIIECPSCHSKYQYDEERFERKPSKKIKCAKCANVFDIHNPAFAPKAPPEMPVGDRTYTGKTEKPKVPADTTEQSPLPSPRTTGKTEPLKLPAGRRLSLAILDGPDAGTVFRIEKPRVSIGRSNADLTLNDTEASRLHATIEVREMVFMLNDAGSTNGTLIGGEKINGPTEISDKTEFQVGATVLMLIVTEDG